MQKLLAWGPHYEKLHFCFVFVFSETLVVTQRMNLSMAQKGSRYPAEGLPVQILRAILYAMLLSLGTLPRAHSIFKTKFFEI